MNVLLNVFIYARHKIVLALQELRKDGFDLAEARYRELKPILDEVIFLDCISLHLHGDSAYE